MDQPSTTAAKSAATTISTATPAAECRISEEQQRRAGTYQLLAALLRQAPGPALLLQIAQLASAVEAQNNQLLIALAMLSLSAQHCDAPEVEEEYQALFIGLGRGELLPYGSWYQTGYLNEKPLSQLRDDLAALGFARADNVHEPEDHVAALLEVMALLITEDGPLSLQQNFFNNHLAPWIERFLDDLAEAQHAVFYKAVARYAQAFMQIEQRYLAMLA